MENIENVNFDELKNEAVDVESQTDDSGLIIADDEPEPTTQEESNAEEYTGSGIVVEAAPSKPKKSGNSAIAIGPMADNERVDDVTRTMNEMDEEIAIAKANAEKIKAEQEANKEEKKSDENGEEKVDVQILIDKTGLGTVTFTDEERKRMDFAKKIKIVEVEEKKLKSIKVKKKIRGEKDFTILRKNFNKAYSPVVAIGSGYTGKMKNISAAEAIQMYQKPGKDTANSLTEKWSVIYDKLIDPSCGPFKNFDDFLSKTAFSDYDCFLYAMISSSFPEKETIQFDCNDPECKRQFTAEYSNPELIRSETFTDEQIGIINKIVSSAAVLEDAKKVAKSSLVNNPVRIKLDKYSGILVDIYLPSVKDMIERVAKNIDEKNESEVYQASIILAQGIKAFYIPDYDDPSDDPAYYEVTDFNNVIKVINSLDERQYVILQNRIAKHTTPYYISYGIKELKCPHCGHNYGFYPLKLDEILFRRVQQQVTTVTE